MITSKKHILPPSTLFILLPLLIISLSSADRCLHGRTDSYAKKYILYNGSSLDLVLETSSRPSHQITTNIFAIFVKEVLAYSKVRIVEIVDDFNEDDVYRRVGSINDQVPPTMINVEVWVPSHEDPSSYIEQYDIQPVGTLGPSGRFGWFIPMDPVRGLPLFNNRKTELFDVHWTVFRNPETAQLFALDEDVVKKFSEDEDGRYYCDKSTCPEGIYTPPQCRSNTKCALLLAPYFNETSFVIDHIQELNLLAKVIWLGPNLKNVSEMLTDQNKPTIILSWTPNEIILPENNFASVSFPSCSILNTTDTVGCKYELNRMVKVGWSKLKTIAKPIYESLHVFSFLEEEFENLLYRYNNFSHVQTPYDIACNWMNDNFDMIIQRWEPSHDKRVKIFIGGIFPLQGTRGSVSDTATSIVHAARMAKDAINNSTLLRGYELSLVLKDGQCKSDQVMKRFIDYLGLTYYDNLVGVLGPACSETVEPIAGVSKFYNTIVISYSAEGVSFSDRSKYPYFFRTIGENKHYNPVYLELFKKLEWKHVAALAEDGQKYTEYISHLQDLLAANGMSIMNKKFPSEREESAMRTYLEELNNHHTKIIIADLYDEVARAVMCEAYKLNMTAHYGYVWFLPQWLSETWYNTTHYNINNGENINCTMEMMIKAINGHLSLTHAYYAPDNSTMQENITVGEWRQKFETKNNMSLSNYGGYAYDAVWVYANALDQLVKRDPKAISDLHSRNTTDTLVNIIKATDFNGVSGKIKFYGGASRYSVINVVQWYNEKTKIIGSYYPNISANKTDSGRLNLKISDIMWLTPNSQKPDDGSIPPDRCALKEIADLLNVDCSTSILIVNVIGILLLVLIAFIAVFIIMRRYNQKVMLTQKYMRSLGIDVSSKNFNSLNKWEIQRDKVVINRKLGEGAFGTVYGGEAFLEDRGWVGVAVKTLKIGSTIEEKLDFLSEAEIMKRFEHKNIVKLLGVCTQNEPVYTIMEFMLYGDLKTFLLARRHLVSEKNTEDSSEISSRKLTNMALDVARALSYLAENKFVHRDVACRNCLLNAQRLVKLGDFGMTRPMFENDYYKFNRKGMLPVRWMAPESLTLGVFRPSSDVWSYGVLLYEIITFGSFPFQGMTNSQVLEHVKQGNVLNVPIGIKPQLEALMKSCWNIEPKRRPHSSEIVEFLANNPRLLVPCPDLPLASVQIDDRSNEIEMKLPETFRKYSVNPVTKPLLMNNGRLANQNGNCCQVSTSVSDGESIPMDHSWVNEPLLSDNSSEQYRTENELNKYVRFNNKQETDDDYLLSDRFDEPEASSDL